MSEFWISRVTQDLPSFVNMTGFWICIGRYYGRVLNIPGFQMCQISAYASVKLGFEYPRIWLNNAWINCSDYGRIKVSRGFEYASGSKYVGALDMTSLWICEGYTEYALIMPHYSWICLNNAEYAWMYLNIPDSVHSLMSLYKLLSNYEDRGVFKTLSNI